MTLAERLQAAHYQLTAPRRALLQVLETSERHLTAAELLERGRAIYPALSRATVYRTLEILAALGALRLIYDASGAPRVACIAESHHHLICLGCGETFHFDDCPISNLEEQIGERFGFSVSSHLLELYGFCQACRP